MLKGEPMLSFQGADHEVDVLEMEEDVILAIMMLQEEVGVEEGAD